MWATGRDARLFLGLLVCLLCRTRAQEGYVRLESFDLDLDSGVLGLRFSRDVNVATFDPTTIRLTDDMEVVHSLYELTGGEVTTVDGSTLSVTLTQSDISSLIAVPGLCLNTFTCYMAYTLWLVEASNGDPTFPGVLRVDNFVPYPLLLEAFSLDMDTGALTLSFNKNVSAHNVDPTAITLVNGWEGLQSHSVLWAECDEDRGCTDAPSITVYLSQDDQNYLKQNTLLCTAVDNTFMSFESSVIIDLGGYNVKIVHPGTSNKLQASRHIEDTTPPQLVSFDMDVDSATFYLRFSEAVDAETFNIITAGQLVLKNPVADGFSVDFFGTDWYLNGSESISTVVVLVAEEVVGEVIPVLYRQQTEHSLLDSSGGLVEDWNDNVQAPTSDSPVVNLDGLHLLTLLADYPFVFDRASHAFLITFPCQVPIVYAAESVELMNNDPYRATRIYPMNEEYYYGEGSVFSYYLPDELIREIAPLDDIAKGVGNTFLRIKEPFCGEEGQIVVRASQYDITSDVIHLVAFTLDMDQLTLQLTFDNLLDYGSPMQPSLVTIQSDETSDRFRVSLSSESQYEIIDWRVDVSLAESDVAALRDQAIARDITTSYLSVQSDVVFDLYGRRAEMIPTMRAIQAERYIAGVPPQPTTLDAFSFDCSSGLLSLTFSQRVYTKTFDLTQLWLENERGTQFSVWKGTYAEEYTSTPTIQLDPVALGDLRGMLGFLVNTQYIYLRYSEDLVYDINDNLVDATRPRLHLMGGQECPCHIGYKLSSDATDCVDIGECMTNNGGCNHMCTNLIGSYYCSCQDGFRLQENMHICEDINECLENISGCSQICVNRDGSYHCECDTTEYALLMDGHSCSRIEHCVDNGCEHGCVDDYGRYRCVCRQGYRLAADQHNCSDINECSEGTSGCTQLCTNSDASYSCSCELGYHLGEDRHTCFDDNECESFNGGCEHYCTNLNGTHQCSCRVGYTLEGQHHCTPDPCNETLVAPEHGSIACSGPHGLDLQATDQVCSFECVPGFYLEGNSERACLPNHTWSGDLTHCERLDCPRLSGFEDASVVLPCDNALESSCQINCLPEFFKWDVANDTVTCVVQSAAENVVGWTTRPVCIKRQPCLPNPCLHGAECTEVETVEGGVPYCHCSGTGYQGELCEVGLVSIPSLPLLTAGETHTFVVSANPDNDLTVTFESKLHLMPNVLTFTPSVTEVTVNVTPSTAGVYTVNAELTGTNAYSYNTPSDVTVVVQSTVPVENVDEILSPGCCSNESESVHSCLGTSSTITFYSTCRHQTHKWEEKARILEGVSFTTAGGLSLPLSLRSVLLQSSGARGISFQVSPYEGEGGTSQCTSCGQQEECSGGWDCSCYDPAPSMAYYLQRESLAKTYLRSIAPLLPSWLQLEGMESERLYDDHSYSVELVDSVDLLRVPQCRGFFSTKDIDFGTYSVLVYSGAFKVTVGTDTVTHTPSGTDALCVAVNLCEGSASPVYISLPAALGLEQFSALDALSVAGWQLEEVAGLVVTVSTPLEYYAEKADLIMAAKVSFAGTQGGTRLGLTFEGIVRLNSTTPLTQLGVSEEEAVGMSVFVDGRTEAVLNASGHLLHLSDLAAHSEIIRSAPAADDTETADLSYSRHNISLTLSQWMVTDKDNIFNRVLSDGGLFNTPVTIEVTLDDSGQFSDVSFHTSGHKLLSGGFMLSGMRHSLHLLHPTSSLLRQSKVTVASSSSHLAIVSSPKASSTLPSFWFLTLNGQANEPVMLTILNTTGNSVEGRTLGASTAVASLFSQQFPVQLQMSEESIKFEVTASLFGVTDAKVSAVAMVGESGQALLSVSGSLDRGDIWQRIEEQAIRHLEQVQGGMTDRAELAQRGLDEVVTMKERIEPQVSKALHEMMNASQFYDDSRRTRQRAELEYHSQVVKVALETRFYEDSDLHRYLSDLCNMEDSCAKEEMSKVVCQECDLPVQTRTRVFGETTCRKKTTFPKEVSQTVWGPLVTDVDGPEVNTISCDPSIPSYWEYPDFGCTVIAVPEKSREVSSPTLHQANYTAFVEREVNYSCNSTWEEEGQWEMDHYCCEVRESALLHNHTCLGRNVACRLARSQAFELFADSTPPDATELFSTLDTLLQQLTLARLKESEAYESYQSASRTHGQLSYYREQIQHLLRHREEQATQLQSMVAPSNINSTYEQPLSIDEITFNLFVESRMSATIPLTILFSLSNSSNHVMIFDFHFSNIPASATAAAHTLCQSVVEIGNKSIQIYEESSTEFDSYCQDLQQVTSLLRYLSSSLERSAEHYNSSMVGVEALTSDLGGRLYAVREWHNSGMWMMPVEMMNDTALCNSSVMLCNNTSNMTDEVSYEAEVTHFEDLVMAIIIASEDLVYSAEERVYTRWLLDMEEDVGRIMFTYGCQGLVDCVLTAVELVGRVLEVANGTAEGAELLKRVPAAKEDLVALTLSREVGVLEMRELLKEMESIVQSSLDLDYWCEWSPNVSVRASHESPVRNGTSMEYECSSSSKFPSLFQWLKDGSALPGETRPMLLLPNVTLESAGEYTCVTWTHKGEEVETTTRLVVHQYPELTLQPMNNVTVFPEEGAVFFRCNASGVPTPSWQWYFRSSNSSERTQLENETSSELVILPPSRSREGWYYCEAYNADDCENCTAWSDGVYLQVLESSVAQFAVPYIIEFTDLWPESNDSSPALGSRTADYVSISDEEELDGLSQNLTELVSSVFELGSMELSEAAVTSDLVGTNTTIRTLSFVISSGSLEPKEDNKPEETFTEIENLRMEWLEGVKAISPILPNGSIVDYGDLGISYDEVSSAEVHHSSLLVRCPEGQEVQRDTNLFCVGCAPGTFQSFAEEQLDSSTTLAYPTSAPCPLGHYQPLPSQTECLPCPVGSFTPLLGQVACQLCPVAEYQDQEGQVVCKACPDGYLTETEGANSSTSCYCVGDSCSPSLPVLYIALGAALLFAGCCLVLTVCLIACKKYRDYRVRKNLPKRLMDIWGDAESEVRQPNFLPADRKLRNMERHLNVGAEGRKIGGDWQDFVESGMMEVGDSWEVFTNPMFEQTNNEDEEEDGRRLWAFQETENGEFEFINAAFMEHAEDEPIREMETSFVEVPNGEEGVDGGSKRESEDKEGCLEEGESEGEGSSDSEEEGSSSSSEESSEGEGEKSGSGGKEESEEGLGKEDEVSTEEAEEDTTAEDTTALLPEASSVEEERRPLAPMTQEEMEHAMRELQQTEQEIAGDTLVGWDDIENMLFNQWAETQELELEDRGPNWRL